MDTLERQLPDVASSMARSVHSGATLLQAFQDVTATFQPPVQHDLRRLTQRVEHGWRLDDALVDWSGSSRSPSLDLLVAACRLGHADGGNLAAALDGVAAALLDQVEIADEVRALSAQARTSAYVLAALPGLSALAFSLLDRRVMALLFASRVGATCLVLGIGLNALGAWWLSRIVRSALV